MTAGTRWTAQSITIRGLSKLRCQDAAWAGTVGSHVVLAVADGVGSYEWSDLAAQVAVGIVQNAAAQSIIKFSDRTTLADEIMRRVHAEWWEWHSAQINGSNFVDRTDSTLAIVILDGHGLSVRSVGDCIVIVSSPGMQPAAVVTPSRDEFGGVETLTHYCRDEMQPYSLELHDPGIIGALLSTDGIERALQLGEVEMDGVVSPVTDILDPYMAELLQEYRETYDIGFVLREMSAGLIYAPGSKGDDIGVAVAVR